MGIVVHEISHKAVSYSKGHSAHFDAFYPGLLLSLGMAHFFGFLIALPGGVYTEGTPSTEEMGKLALAGPLSNLISILFFLPLVGMDGYYGVLGGIGLMTTSLLAFFNMVPLAFFGISLDGYKVFKWSKKWWAIVFITTLTVIVLVYSSFYYGWVSTPGGL